MYLADITVVLANDVDNMSWGDRLSLGESRYCHSRSVIRGSVARRVARIACCQARDTNTDVNGVVM